MRAVVFRNERLQYVTDEPSPQPRLGEALVRVRVAGICRTDLELTKGYLGFSGILGHEFVGEMRETHGALQRGQRVVGEINCGCGECALCGAGMERHCPQRTVLGILGREGCMADALTLPIENLLPVPDDVRDEDAVFTEPLAAVLEIFEQVHIQPHHAVAVLGDGKLGLLTAVVFQALHPGPLLLVGHHPERASNFEGLEIVHENELASEHDSRFDFVVEATGATEGLQTAMRIVKPRGAVVLKSTMERAAPLDLTPLVINEVSLVGSRCGRFAPALELLRRNILPLHALRTASYPLESAMEAWEHAQRTGTLKLLLTMR